LAAILNWDVMPIIARLASLYESRGIHITSGLNPSHFGNFPLAPYHLVFKNGESVTNGLGIALQESISLNACSRGSARNACLRSATRPTGAPWRSPC
jgi:hypothetical protein